MKLLVVSHSCSTASNQRLYSEIQTQTGWNLTLIIPSKWKDEYGHRLDEEPWRGCEEKVEKVPVLGNGNIILHVYRRNWGWYLRRERFDAIYVNHEPYALATAQICLANQRQPCPAAFGFYSCQISKNLILSRFQPWSAWFIAQVALLFQSQNLLRRFSAQRVTVVTFRSARCPWTLIYVFPTEPKKTENAFQGSKARQPLALLVASSNKKLAHIGNGA